MVVESLGEVGIVERKFFCQGRLPLCLAYGSFHELKHHLKHTFSSRPDLIEKSAAAFEFL